MSNTRDNLLVIPLDNKVLLPSVILRLELSGHQAEYLVDEYTSSQQDDTEANKSTALPIVGCIPFKPSTSNDNEDRQSWMDDPHQVLCGYGCTGRITRIVQQQDDPASTQKEGAVCYDVYMEGLARFKALSYEQDTNGLQVRVSHVSNRSEREAREAMAIFSSTTVPAFLQRLETLQVPLAQQLQEHVSTLPVPVLADMLVSIIDTSFEERLAMLMTESVKDRIHLAQKWLTRETQSLLSDTTAITTQDNTLSKRQRASYLRQQLEAIRREIGPLGPGDTNHATDVDDLTLLKQRLTNAHMPEDAANVAIREFKRLQNMSTSSAEWSVLHNYLELLADLPWNTQSNSVLIDIAVAKKQLEDDHFGLDHVKKRIVEYLSVAKIKGDLKAPILCFVGPPGVGKTSLGKSIATALSRKFHRIALGGVRDEADMRGHRRAYVSAMPGLIIQGIRRCGANNPVMLLDEIDKVSRSASHGDPAAALLEVLDPEQNNTFHDHYLNLPYDLSSILFIATANSIHTIPQPLLDRMEVIQLHGYTFEEKLHIARTHLLPKQIQRHGLAPNEIDMTDDVILWIAEQYTRESGVRTLERTLASVIRAKCVELADLRENDLGYQYTPGVTQEDVLDILGVPPYDKDTAGRQAMPGVVTGLAYSGSGNGGILFVESSKMPGSGDLQLTGSLGEVIKESAHIALTWVKVNAYDLKIATTTHEKIVANHDIHIHIPQGAVSKDGPSAGVTMVCSLVSLLTDSAVKSTTAMTGEISLRGLVLPVGGIKEKVISAHRAGIRKIILPERNRKDVVADVPINVKNDIEFVYAKTIWDVIENALDQFANKSLKPMESHL
ncbi:atp-dependent protease la [Lichtheimia corymbifera JMRC:FSU:9682]|uniref:Lon protease homolog n=1 Tax=Lichtheimia corymbifera JMRC:FSU:9682 TaxID=1263082 RepID=A0A068RI99_9FUNG|nr:atp-dependent protease la [Lichtheimia corymbifera JMRC:FSU:9682]